ncbi:MBL fold metallo-hydrolase [bacterium]|nr:MBL fold metallo-hydrolase [bacterium]
MDYESVVVGALETNCYLVYCPQSLKCAVVDPGAEPKKIFQVVEKKGLQPVILINTHGHVDHVGANRDVKEKFDIPLCIHPSDRSILEKAHQSGLNFLLGTKDSPEPDRLLNEGDHISIGKSELRVIHTPGHSPGSVCLIGDGFVLSGDALFYRGVGRTDLPGGSWKELENSVRNKILTLSEDTRVLPGHGPSTLIGDEKESNPFI